MPASCPPSSGGEHGDSRGAQGFVHGLLESGGGAKKGGGFSRSGINAYSWGDGGAVDISQQKGSA